MTTDDLFSRISIALTDYENSENTEEVNHGFLEEFYMLLCEVQNNFKEVQIDSIQDIYEAALILVDSVEKYVRQECSRSTLLSMKDKLKELLEK